MKAKVFIKNVFRDVGRGKGYWLDCEILVGTVIVGGNIFIDGQSCATIYKINKDRGGEIVAIGIDEHNGFEVTDFLKKEAEIR